MTDKLFHVTNDDTLLSGVYFDQQFSAMRERGENSFKIDREAKEALEKSIQRGKSVTVRGGFSCQNAPDAEKTPNFTEGGTMYPKDGI